MKKLIYFLFMIMVVFTSCDIVNSITKKDPIAEIHIPVNTKMDRRVYNFDDVNDFTITLQGEDVDGNSVYEFCGDYDYDTTNDEIVIQIMKAGYYFVDVAANKKLSDGSNKVVANGKSGAFRVIDGDVKTIIIDMVYTESKTDSTSTLYKFYHADSNTFEIVSIVFDDSLAANKVESYVNFLKENTSSGNWYDNWGKIDYEIDLEKMVICKTIEYIPSPYFVVNYDLYYKYVFADENAENYQMKKSIDTDYSNYFNTFKTLDYIYTTINDTTIEKIAYYVNRNNKSIKYDDYVELKDLKEYGGLKGENWVEPLNPFDNIVSIDFTDTTTDGGIQINW